MGFGVERQYYYEMSAMKAKPGKQLSKETGCKSAERRNAGRKTAGRKNAECIKQNTEFQNICAVSSLTFATIRMIRSGVDTP